MAAPPSSESMAAAEALMTSEILRFIEKSNGVLDMDDDKARAGEASVPESDFEKTILINMKCTLKSEAMRNVCAVSIEGSLKKIYEADEVVSKNELRVNEYLEKLREVNLAIEKANEKRVAAENDNQIAKGRAESAREILLEVNEAEEKTRAAVASTKTSLKLVEEEARDCDIAAQNSLAGLEKLRAQKENSAQTKTFVENAKSALKAERASHQNMLDDTKRRHNKEIEAARVEERDFHLRKQWKEEIMPSYDLYVKENPDAPKLPKIYDESALDCEVGKRLSGVVSVRHVPKVNGDMPSPDDVTTDHERLLQRLQLYGLVELQISGDGNCQFGSLSDQIYRSAQHHELVRQKVINQLKSQPQWYKDYVPMAYDDYLKTMSKTGEWGDHVTLQAAADWLGIKIFVLTSFKDTCYIEILPRTEKSKRIIFLSFWAEVHYNSVYPVGELRSV